MRRWCDIHYVTLHPAGSPELEEEMGAVRPSKPLPRLKVEGSVSDIRVAIVEDMEDPQALTLRVRSQC